MELVIVVIIGVIGLYLLTRRWVWVLAFWAGGILSLFTMIASIIHFQILGAFGFFILMVICFAIAGAIND